MAYDETGALGGTFAPAFIFGDPVSEAAVNKWNAAHLRTRPVQTPLVTPGPAPTSPADTLTPSARDALAMALTQQGGGGGSGGGPAGPGAAGVGAPGTGVGTGV